MLVIFDCKSQSISLNTENIEQMKHTWDTIIARMEQLRKDDKHFSPEYMSLFNFANRYQLLFAVNYPEHPYTEQVMDMFAGRLPKAGTAFIDFTAVDLNGASVKLSERIAGKTAVLHLWGSWCVPCRKKGIELIPIYEEFRDKGFVVVGVASERNIPAAEAAIRLDKYPWENLVELNNEQHIWFKYGIEGAGGCHFLIDEKGKIVAVAPSIKQIRNFLLNKL